MTVKKSDFDLEKWYLDCVTESGEVFIGYVATLKWKNLKVPYSSVIFVDKKQQVKVSTRFSKPGHPVMAGNELSWEDPGLKVNGHWEKHSSAVEAKLHENEFGRLLWQCYQPSSKTRISYKGNFYTGLGYAEKLHLNDLPWNIDMRTLRWGRYCSTTDNLVWIQLAGDSTRQWLWHNGSPVDSAVILDDKINITRDEITLKLDRSVMIESEQKIFNTVKSLIKYLPGFDKIIPARFLYADETKWRSHGQLFKNGILLSEGWAIHEIVDFSHDHRKRKNQK